MGDWYVTCDTYAEVLSKGFGTSDPMQLIQIFQPVRDNASNSFPLSKFEDVKRQLSEQFGSSARSCGRNVEESTQRFIRDDVVTVGVMTPGDKPRVVETL